MHTHINRWTNCKTLKEKLLLRMFYKALQVYHAGFISFAHRFIDLSNVSHEIAIVTGAYGVIKLNHSLNILGLLGMTICGSALLLLLADILENGSDMRKESIRFIQLSKTNTSGTLRSKTLDRIFFKSLREICILNWNVPVHQNTFLTIVTDIMLVILINLLLTF